MIRLWKFAAINLVGGLLLMHPWGKDKDVKPGRRPPSELSSLRRWEDLLEQRALQIRG